MIEFKCVRDGFEIIFRLPHTDYTVTDMAEHFHAFMLALGYHLDNLEFLID